MILNYSNGLVKTQIIRQTIQRLFFIPGNLFPGDNVSSNLLCYERCPNPANLDNGTEWGNPSVFFSDVNTDNKTTAGNAKTYSFDNTTSGMVLKYGSDNITFSKTNQAMPWGLFSGPLFDTTTVIDRHLHAIGTTFNLF